MDTSQPSGQRDRDQLVLDPTAASRLLLMFIALACTSGTVFAQSPRVPSSIRDSAGVRIVSHPGTTDSASSRAVEDLRIGVEMGDSVYMFNRVGQIAVDRQGRLHVADGAMRIRVYGPDGKFIRAFGRRGQGPGEFTSIDRLWFAGDTLVVTSLGARRATLISPADDMLATWDLRLADGGRAELLARRPNGWLAWVRPRSREMSLTPLTLFQDTVQLAMYDPVTKVPANPVLRRQAGQRRAAQADLYPGTPLFEPLPLTAIGADGTQFHSPTGQYTIDVFDPAGRHIRRISRAVPVKPITPKHVEQLNDYLDAPRSPGGRPRAPRGGEQRLGVQVQEKHPLAAAFAVLGAMLVAPDNSLIVQRIDAIDPIELEWMTGFNAAERSSTLIGRGPTRWERFDPQGRYVGAVNLPALFQPRAYDGQRITGVQRNGDGVEFVVRYRMVPM